MISRIITLIISFLILLAVFLWSGEVLILLMFGVVLGLLLIGAVCLLITKSKTVLTVKVKNSTVNGEPIKVLVSASNQSVLPVFFASVRLNVINMNFGLETTQTKRFSISGRTQKEISIDVNCQYCGKYFITVKSIRLYDYWGIFSCKKMKKQVFETCMYPQYYMVNSISQVMRTNYEKEKYFSHRKGTILSELLQYREYHPGDNLNETCKLEAFKQGG